MSEDRPPPRWPRQRARLPFETTGRRASFKSSSLVVYGVLTAGMIGVALYTALVLRLPLTSGWVAGPAIGAVWFALRTFMIWGSKS